MITDVEKLKDASSLGDFTLFNKANKEFDFTFKRVVDDILFKATHKIEEEGSFDFVKHKLISERLMNTVGYIMLPKIKVIKHSKKALPDLTLQGLKERGILPETIMNESYFLGYHYTLAEQMRIPKSRHFIFSLPNFIKDVAF